MRSHSGSDNRRSGVNSASPRTAPRGRRPLDVVATAVTAAVLCFAFTVYWFGSVASEPEQQDASETGKLISSMYDPPTNAIENALVKGDGQIYAGQATDPLALHPEMVRGGRKQQAFRYQRPMYGWLGWIASAGRREAVAWALVTVTVVSVALLVYVAAVWIVTAGAYPGWALLILAMPGVMSNLTWVGPEALGVALMVVGLKHWMRLREAARNCLVPVSGCPDRCAVACFAAAGLCHESLLFVPCVVTLAALAKCRLRLAAAAALSAAPYLLWVLYLKVHIGAWPRSSVSGRFSLIPFSGMLQACRAWRPEDWFSAVVLLALAMFALKRGRNSGLRLLIAAYLIISTIFGSAVWFRFQDFGRVLLPLSVLSLIAVVSARARHRQTLHAPGAQGRFLSPD